MGADALNPSSPLNSSSTGPRNGWPGFAHARAPSLPMKEHQFSSLSGGTMERLRCSAVFRVVIMTPRTRKGGIRFHPQETIDTIRAWPCG